MSLTTMVGIWDVLFLQEAFSCPEGVDTDPAGHQYIGGVHLWRNSLIALMRAGITGGMKITAGTPWRASILRENVFFLLLFSFLVLDYHHTNTWKLGKRNLLSGKGIA